MMEGEKIFLGDFIYAEATRSVHDTNSLSFRLTDEDGTGKVLQSVELDSNQMRKLLAWACDASN
jgi:hypothetical protein